ncbi:MAG: hypothetical protein KC503_20060 [Myxococcales bacterium]|nr:hypothetical protein [Myxococcales bacterium]
MAELARVLCVIAVVFFVPSLGGGCSDSSTPAADTRRDAPPDVKLGETGADGPRDGPRDGPADGAADIAADAAADVAMDGGADVAPDAAPSVCSDGGDPSSDVGTPLSDAGVGCVATVPYCCGQPNLLVNGGFETVPNAGTGQGLLPSSWVTTASIVPGADTYSNDGSYGAAPSAFGNFTGVTAYEGIRWVAGGSVGFNESFGQTLATPLVPGKTYRLEARIRPSVNRPIAGSYAVYLQDTATAPTTQVVLGTFCHSEAPAWVSRSFTFVAPANAASLPVLSFLPVSADTRTTYPGLDDVSLSDVTPCMQP